MAPSMIKSGDNLSKIRIYPIEIQFEQDLASEVARIATLSLKLGYQQEKEGRLLSKEEAYYLGKTP